MTDRGRELLTVLKDFLPTLPPDRLDMTAWVSLDDEGAKEFTPDMLDPAEPCGTAACACGWATTLPAFKAAGLSLDRSGLLRYSPPSGWPATYGGFEAVQRLFGLVPREASFLFGAYAYRPSTPQAVADRIGEFLAANAATGQAVAGD